MDVGVHRVLVVVPAAPVRAGGEIGDRDGGGAVRGGVQGVGVFEMDVAAEVGGAVEPRLSIAIPAKDIELMLISY